METIWFGYCLKVWGQYEYFFYKLRARFTNSLRQCELSFGIKIVLSELTKDAQWRISTWKGMDSYFCAWSYGISFRRKIYGRRVFKWITERILRTFVLVKLLVFAPLFKGIVHSKMKILSLITHPHVVPNQQDLRSSSECKLKYFCWNRRAIWHTIDSNATEMLPGPET